MRFKKLGIWKRVSKSPWSASIFVQPTKTGDIRVLTDVRKLNKCIVQQPHPLPKFGDLLQKQEGFKFATASDLCMGYYHIPLHKYSQELCGTVMRWGLYQYTILPMGICDAPDIFQIIMSCLLGNLKWCHSYIDDIIIMSSGSYQVHLLKVEEILHCLKKMGF